MAYKLFLLTLFGLFIILLALKYPKKFILFYFLIKPAVDYFAESGTTFLGYNISTTYIGGALVPLCALFFVLDKKKNIGVFPFKKVLFAYILINILSFVLQGDYSLGTLNPFGILVRVVLPITLYISIPYILKYEADILKFLKVVALSGIFPMFVGFMQLGGLIPYNRDPATFGALTLNRLTGGYADSFSLTMPLIIAIFAILFLIQYKGDTNNTKKQDFIFKILIGLYMLTVFFAYHRMTYIILLTVLIIWLIHNKQKYAIIFTLIGFAFIVYFDQSFFKNMFADAYEPFTPEAKLYYGQAFHGRGWLWRGILNSYANASFLEKFLGVRMISRYPHNDYIRILYSNGIVGLMLYLTLLVSIGSKIISLLRKYSNTNNKFIFQLSAMSLSIFIAYTFASTSLSISMISTLPWFFWIFAGLLFYQNRIYRLKMSHFRTNELC